MSPDFKGRSFKMHYVQEGEGRAILFLHGLAMDHTVFAAQFEDLPDAYRCIALDLRGHGHTEFPVGLWAIDDLVVDVIEFIEGLDIAPCHLVGHSLGGIAAIGVAVEREELLRSLVLIDTSAGVESGPSLQGLEATMGAIEQGGVEPIIDGMTAIAFGPRYREEHPEGVTAFHDRLRTMNRDALVEGLRAITTRPDRSGRLGEIHLPTLVIHGSDDMRPIGDSEAIASGIAGAELLKLPGVGHTPQQEAPDEVNAALTRFFARVD